MKRQDGFTLIELVMVIVILGILSAVALPRFVDLQTDALEAAQRGMNGAVKSAHAIAIADLKDFPTVLELGGNPTASPAVEGYVQGNGVAAAAGGVEVDINGTTYTVPTYTDTACGTQTTGTGQTVRCVGEI